MDNAAGAWELPRRMRRAVVAWVLGALLLALACPARASEARQHVDEANAALAAEPPRSDVARQALAQAVAAADDPQAVAEADFLLGRLDEESFAFAQALLDDRAAIAAAPGTRWALRASDRVEWLRSRSEGDFGPLARLEKLRRDPVLSSDPAAIDALAHEARMLVAEAWLGRLNRPDEAIEELRKVAAEPRADALTLRLAERQLVDALVEQDRLDEAIAEATARSNRLDSRFVKQVKRLRTRRWVRRASRIVLGAFAVLVAVALIRAGRRRALGDAVRGLRGLGPVTLLFAACIALGGGTLASNYETGNGTPFYALGAIVLPMALVARAWSAIGASSGAARAGRAALCGAAIAAAAFTLLDLLNPAYLEGFGL
jgi:tetratricopeptide (TPR) repeat protein